ncbi:MAG TPA: glycosyltransferase [Longimicrobiales bacterium]|nr:glycosyltransferase [Longimicrobiales bacterium]
MIAELAEALAQSAGVTDVVVSEDAFWDATGPEFDVVHLHWPEALLGWRRPEPAQLDRLSARLAWWRERAVLVATVHNIAPHMPAARDATGRAYELVFRAVHGLIHMGAASAAAVEQHYPHTRALPGVIIPHARYSSFPADRDAASARASLQLDAGEAVFLCFGRVRRTDELRLVREAFRAAAVPQGRLLIAGKLATGMSRAERLRVTTALALERRARACLRFVPAGDVQRFFLASDVVVVPRLEALNSGNVILGFGFGRVVVGPDAGVVGELLRSTDNPVFTPGDPASLARAMRRGLELSRQGQGERNREHAEREWDGARTAAAHVAFFREMMRSRRPTATESQAAAASPAFSVVIPAYNRAHLLPRAIGSVLAQTMPDLELIIVDDGSTDDTRALVEAITDPRVRYVHQQNAGAAAARNHGARLAQGTYITFLDSDDEARPHWLATLRTALEQAGADVVCCGLEKHGDEAGVRTRVPEDMGPMFDHVTGRFTNGGVFALRRSVFEEVGGYADSLRSGQHTELAMRLIPLVRRRGYVLHSIPDALVHVHVHEGPRIRGNPESIYLGSSYTLRAHRDLFRRDPTHHAKYQAIAGVNALRIGRLRDSRRHFVQAVLADPVRLEHWSRLLLSLAPSAAKRRWAGAAADASDS